MPGFDASQPPGEYLVDRDEEPVEIASHLAWRRVATFIHLPAISTKGSTQQMVPIDPALLDAALRPVEIHLEFMTAAARWIMALKLWSVLSARMAMRLNSLSLQKKFSMR